MVELIRAKAEAGILAGMRRWSAAWVVLLFVSSLARCQELAGLLDRLCVPAERTRATVELRHHGSAAATALVDALARADCRAPQIFAEVLADLGDASRGEVARLTVMLPGRSEPQRTLLLRALANGVLGCTDERAIDALRDVLGAWASAGFFYSEDPEQPTFAWYEYVRLQRRLAVRRRGMSPGDLGGALDAMRAGRAQIQGFVGVVGGQESDLHDLSSFGQHATREELEAIAELALAHGKAARSVVDEMAKYLTHEPPRPGEILREHCAGIGETAPAALPEVEFATLWRRDDWRFAIARAVVAVSQEQADRLHAIRHLLHAPLATDRLDALDAVRNWPQPWREFAPDLGACLDSADRIVVRDALITLGLAKGIALPATQLERLAAGRDKELAALAQRLLPR